MFLITIAVLLRIFSNPVANVFQKQLTFNKHNPLFVNFFTYLLIALLCIFFINNIPLKELPKDFWLYSILVGLAGALGNGFLVKALQKGELSVLGPINSYKSVIGVIFGIFLLGEIPNYWGMLGIILVIYGSYFVLDSTEEKLSVALLKRSGIIFRLFAVVLTAIEAVFIKKVILTSSPVAAFISWSCFGALFSFFLLFTSNLEIKNELKKFGYSDIAKYFLLVMCVATMQFTTNYVFKYIDVGYALSFFQLSIIVSVLLGHHIFNEKNIRKKLFGSVIMIIGSVVIILLKN